MFVFINIIKREEKRSRGKMRKRKINDLYDRNSKYTVREGSGIWNFWSHRITHVELLHHEALKSERDTLIQRFVLK